MLINTLAVILSLFAFLGGLRLMRFSMESLAKGRLPIILKRFVRTPSRGILTGTIVTGLVQSSAAITAISVGMVSGGSMVFRDALGIVLGANVGSTITPQILTLNLWGLVVPCLILGVVGWLSRIPRFLYPSGALVGFASVFISLKTLSMALEPLTHTPWFVQFIAHAGTAPLVALIVGTIASALIQSSTATTVITMALAAEGLIPTSGAIAVVLGANVGTCLTSVIAAIGQSRAAQQVALSHVLLNVGGALVMVPLLSPFTASMEWLTTDITQQIANAHTVFNVVCTLVVWPVTHHFARIIERLLPDNQSA